MRFAICNETFENWPHDRACACARECGYTGLEVAPFTLATNTRQITAAERADFRRTAESHGLEIIGIHWLLAKTTGFHVTTRDVDVRRRTAEYLGDLARLCADLGGKIMVFGSPQQRNRAADVSPEEGMNFAAEVFRAAMPAIEACGVTLAIEPLGPVEGNFLNTAAEGMDLVRRIDSPHCRLHLDCKAMSTEATPIPDLIRRHIGDMVHFHANDPNRLGPGMGELDFKPILAALREVNYDGWVSVEVFDYSPGPERLARESFENMQKAIVS
jgi:sugar phosphate isomerase/epimerase